MSESHSASSVRFCISQLFNKIYSGIVRPDFSISILFTWITRSGSYADILCDVAEKQSGIKPHIWTKNRTRWIKSINPKSVGELKFKTLNWCWVQRRYANIGKFFKLSEFIVKLCFPISFFIEDHTCTNDRIKFTASKQFFCFLSFFSTFIFLNCVTFYWNCSRLRLSF